MGVITLRIPDSVHGRIKARAHDRRLSMNQFLACSILRGLHEPPFTVVPMPYNEEGQGPETDTSKIAGTRFEVWDLANEFVIDFETMLEAREMADRLNGWELVKGQNPDKVFCVLIPAVTYGMGWWTATNEPGFWFWCAEFNTPILQEAAKCVFAAGYCAGHEDAARSRSKKK